MEKCRMPRLRESQEQFAGMIMGGNNESVRLQLAESEIPRVDRLAIYLNNVYYSLTEALGDTFPVIKRLVGDDFFRFAARQFIETYPPNAPVLASYGSNFGEFLGSFEPAASLPYLPDVAQLEFAWLQAYHERDADPLDVAALRSVPADQYAEICLQIHPTRRFIRSDFPIAKIWEVNQHEEASIEPVNLSSGSDYILVIRPHLDVEIRTMTAAAYEFVACLDAGNTLAQALDVAVQKDETFNMQTTLQQLISGETFSSFQVR
jgi:hypothetical protein